MKNLVIVHLESTSWQRVSAFRSAFPNLRRFLQNARVFNWFISGATSTRSVLTYLFHANDFEYELASQFGARPAANNPDIFSILRAHGYHTDILCLDVVTTGKVYFKPMADMWPLASVTGHPADLLQKFEQLTNVKPFAIYICNLITHLEHSLSLAAVSDGLTDQVGSAHAAADEMLGQILAILERKSLVNDTTIAVYGDHGDDLWTHGFKGGLTHATEPYTDMIHTPLAIHDTNLANGEDERIAGTIDLAPTCLELLGIPLVLPFRHSGRSLLTDHRRFAFAQNFFGRQPDNSQWGIRQAMSVTNRTHTLIVSSAGLEFYAHRLDPGGHTNLLHFFEIGADGRLILQPTPRAGAHFRAALRDNPWGLESLSREFELLRTSLKARLTSKQDYILEQGADLVGTLTSQDADRINRNGHDVFFSDRT